MAYPAEQIISIETRISAAGLGTANFGAGMFFADFDDTTVTAFTQGSYRDYGSAVEVAVDFNIASDTYLAAQAWFSAIPKPKTLRIYRRIEDDTAVESLNDAINKGIWFYWFEFDTSVRADLTSVLAIEAAADAAGKFFAFTSNDANVRDPAVTTDIVSRSVTQGNRRTFILSHAAAKYAGFELAAVFSRVNFSANDTTITGEFKKLPGIEAENLNSTAYGALKAKGAVFYTKVETGGQVDNGRVINSKTTSTYGEFIDDVFNLDAFVNYLTVALYNTLANQVAKLKQTPEGELELINAANQVGQQFIANGYLGARNYLDPDDGKTKLTTGYEILTVPNDILDLSDADRAARKSAPILMRIYRAGATHAVDVIVDVE